MWCLCFFCKCIDCLLFGRGYWLVECVRDCCKMDEWVLKLLGFFLLLCEDFEKIL